MTARCVLERIVFSELALDLSTVGSLLAFLWGMSKVEKKDMDLHGLTHYIFLDDPCPRGDVGFVFGTWHAWNESVEKAAWLYHGGLVPRFIVSGGAKSHETGETEGDVMAMKLEAYGVPRKDLLVENRSSNTLENVLFSKEMIDREWGLESIQTIVGVVKNYHARRALMTLRRHLPDNIRLKSAPYISPVYPFTKEDWHTTDRGRKKVLVEREKIRMYLAKGDLKEL